MIIIIENKLGLLPQDSNRLFNKKYYIKYQEGMNTSWMVLEHEMVLVMKRSWTFQGTEFGNCSWTLLNAHSSWMVLEHEMALFVKSSWTFQGTEFRNCSWTFPCNWSMNSLWMVLKHEMVLFMKSSWTFQDTEFRTVHDTEFINSGSWTWNGPIHETTTEYEHFMNTKMNSLWTFDAVHRLLRHCSSRWVYLKGVSSLTSLYYLWRPFGPFSLSCTQKWP